LFPHWLLMRFRPGRLSDLSGHGADRKGGDGTGVGGLSPHCSKGFSSLLSASPITVFSFLAKHDPGEEYEGLLMSLPGDREMPRSTMQVNVGRSGFTGEVASEWSPGCPFALPGLLNLSCSPYPCTRGFSRSLPPPGRVTRFSLRCPASPDRPR